MNYVNGISLYRGDYKTERQYIQAIVTLFMVLMRSQYACKVYREDGPGIRVEFEYDDGALGANRLCWLTPEEEEELYYSRRNVKDDQHADHT